ncbi:MAG: 2Fe-2S iron-sulfur cluster-binding protein [Candidatus Methylomirabilales bacterium]
MTPAWVDVSLDGRRVRASAGAPLLAVAREAGVAIPSLCHHEAVEPAGACRLCLVDVARPGRDGDLRMVASCMYPAEDGLRVFTDTDRVRAVRRDVLDLLLARCPESRPVQRLARAYGLTESSYAGTADPTDCVLCGLCVRVCQRLGFSAIAMVGRGIGREVAPPFREAPPDCVGCLACAAACPAGRIPHAAANGSRTVWGRSFPLLACPSCGRPHITVAQAAAWAARTGQPPEEFAACDACKRAAAAAAMARLGGGGPSTPA